MTVLTLQWLRRRIDNRLALRVQIDGRFVIATTFGAAAAVVVQHLVGCLLQDFTLLRLPQLYAPLSALIVPETR